MTHLLELSDQMLVGFSDLFWNHIKPHTTFKLSSDEVEAHAIFCWERKKGHWNANSHGTVRVFLSLISESPDFCTIIKQAWIYLLYQYKIKQNQYAQLYYRSITMQLFHCTEQMHAVGTSEPVGAAWSL